MAKKLNLNIRFLSWVLCVCTVLSQIYIGIGSPVNKTLIENSSFQPRILFSKRAGSGGGGSSPDENISQALEVLQSIVTMLGQSSSGGLTYGLTGISLQDCSISFKDKNPSEISCDEFFETLQTCEALQNMQKQMKAAQKRYQKIKGRSASARKPCAESGSESESEPEAEGTEKKSKKSKKSRSKSKSKSKKNQKHKNKNN